MYDDRHFHLDFHGREKLVDCKKLAVIGKTYFGCQDFDESVAGFAVLFGGGGDALFGRQAGDHGGLVDASGSGGDHRFLLRVWNYRQPPFSGTELGIRGERGKAKRIGRAGRNRRLHPGHSVSVGRDGGSGGIRGRLKAGLVRRADSGNGGLVQGEQPERDGVGMKDDKTTLRID